MSEPNRPPIDEAALAARFGTGWPVRVVAQTGSTNADLIAADAPSRTVLVADLQTGGRGRLARSWTSPSRAGLTFSILLRPSVPPSGWGWLPLLAGLALCSAIGDDARLKWPNDVLMAGIEPDGSPVDRKVAGILLEAVPTGTAGAAGPAVVIGIGLNVSTTATELPVPEATSMLLQGHPEPDRTALLGSFLAAFDPLLTAWQAAGGDADAAGLAAAYRDRCATLGQRVSVELPARVLAGTAVGIDRTGRLLVEPDDGSATQPVAAGDVTHIRPVSR